MGGHRWAKGSQGWCDCVWRKKRLQGGSELKNAQYSEHRALGPLSLEGRVEGSAPHPSPKGQGEGSEAYSVASVDVLKWYVFPDILFYYIYL